jgi:hypothetical protein
MHLAFVVRNRLVDKIEADGQLHEQGNERGHAKQGEQQGWKITYHGSFLACEGRLS